MSLYRAVDVWERRDPKTLVRYRCFQSLITGKFCVQSSDFFRDMQPKNDFEKQFVELLMEQDPAERAADYSTLEEAIAAHKRDFQG